MIQTIVILFVVSCVPDQEPIGTTVWSYSLGEPATLLRASDIAASGDMAFVTANDVHFLGRDADLRWTASHADTVVDIALDIDGTVAVLSSTGGQLSLERLGPDGDVEYTLTFPEATFQGAPLVVVDARRVVWLVFDKMGTSDLGGGSIGTPGLRRAHWGQFARDGSYLGSGALEISLPFLTSNDAVALPSEGILVRDELARLFAVGSGGEILWTLGSGLSEPIASYVVHADNELTLVRGPELVRLTADRTERWHYPLACGAQLAGVSDGSVVVSGTDGLPGDRGFACVAHADRDGHMVRELIDADFLMLVRGAPTDGYRCLMWGTAEVDMHDRTIDASQSAIVARRLP